MRSIPDAVELLEIIAQFLREDVVKLTDAPINFYVRVAANALDIVRREISQGAEADAAATARLRKLLGNPDGALGELESILADQIREDLMTADTPGLIEHLWQSTLAEVAIDQPTYATYKHLMNKGQERGQS
jgi:hypothetical protein